MTVASDPQLYSSGYERNRLDRYWTSPWMTNELCLRVDLPHNIWEPAAGRGDMSRALKEKGHAVYSSDIDMGEFDYNIGEGHECSFLDETVDTMPPGTRAIVTNPPYSEPWRGIADDFVEHSIKLLTEANSSTWTIAMLLRSEFRSGKSARRRLKFGECPHYWGELVLTTRPRWDLGDPDRPETAAPRHNSSWFIWKKDCMLHDYGDDDTHYPKQLFSYMPKGFKP